MDRPFLTTVIESLEFLLYLPHMRYNYFQFQIAIFVLPAKGDIADIRIWCYFRNVKSCCNLSDTSPETRGMITSGLVAAISTSGIRKCRTATTVVSWCHSVMCMYSSAISFLPFSEPDAKPCPVLQPPYLYFRYNDTSQNLAVDPVGQAVLENIDRFLLYLCRNVRYNYFRFRSRRIYTSGKRSPRKFQSLMPVSAILRPSTAVFENVKGR